MKKEKSKIKFLLYFVAIICLILFSLILISSVINIGEKLRNISKYLEYGFYVLVVLLIVFGIILPIVKIVASPSLQIVTSTETPSSKALKTYKKVAKNIVKNNDLSLDDKLLLMNSKTNEEILRNINYIFENVVKKQLNGIIISNARTVFISTAICQNGNIDMITSFTINLQMIKQLVLKCGFRPSMKNLSKLTINVFSTALIADGMENLSLSDVLPNSVIDNVSNIPMLGKVLESTMQGAANALLTIRIGCVTRRYLYSDGAIVTKEDIRRSAYKETLKILPTVLADVTSFIPKKVVRFFVKSKEDKNKEKVEVI